MSVQNSDYIQTRIFRKTGQVVQQSGGPTRGEGRILSEPEIFGQKGTEYMGKPPQNSIHEGSRQLQKNMIKSTESGWLTIYGLPYNYNVAQEIIKMFTKYGEILIVEPNSGNAISIEFARRDIAEKVAKENSSPFFIGKYAAFAKIGRPIPPGAEKLNNHAIRNVELFEEEEDEPIIGKEEITFNSRIENFRKSLLSLLF